MWYFLDVPPGPKGAGRRPSSQEALRMSTELLTAALLLGLGLAALAARVANPRLRSLAICGALAAGAGVAWAMVGARILPLPEERMPFRPIAVPADGFVSSTTCRSCHPHEYATWHRSYHRTMTQRTTPETILADFPEAAGPEDPRALSLELNDREFRVGRAGEISWVAYLADETPDRWVQRPVLLSTGSHAAQLYWYPSGEGRKMELFPFVHLVSEDRWTPRQSIFLQPPPEAAADFPQPYSAGDRWNHTCIHCHTTHGRPRFETLDSQVSEFGIACESCHGPAEEHLAANRAPWDRYGNRLQDGDPTIVQPVKLDHERSSMVCGICHGITYPEIELLPEELEQGRAFRPGDDLRETRRVVQPTLGPESLAGLPEAGSVAQAQAFWKDGMVRVKGREYNGLLETPCYQRGEMSCFSCHAMHQPADDPRPMAEWANDQLKPEMEGNEACLQCHVEYESEPALVAHTRHPAESTGSNCYDCHMPYTTFGLLKAIRSHQVDSPSVAATLETGRPNACNNCHLDRTLDWTAQNLAAGWNVEPPPLSDVHRAVPASLLDLLAGDATLRALAVWHMSWEPARETSGARWMTPFLAQTLLDPYDAVRFGAVRALRKEPVAHELELDYLASPEDRTRWAASIADRFRQAEFPPGVRADPVSLLGPGVSPEVFRNLVRLRDDSVVSLAE